MEVYEKFGLSAYRQHILLRITQEARDQNALLTIKDLVKLLKSSYSTIKRDIKYFRERELYVPLRGIVKDIGPSSHKSKIVELYVKGYTPTEIQRSTRHSLQSIERYIKDFSRVSILTQREESIDNIRLIVGISERLIKEYQELFIKYKDGDHKQRVEELIDNITVYDSPMSFKKNGDENVKEDWYRKTYGPSAAKTYETSLFNLITTEFGYIGGPDVVKLFAKKIVELNDQYYLRGDFVRPGQMRWLVLKAGQKYSKSKKLSDMQLIPVTLTLINPEDIEDRITKVKKNELIEKLIVRLCTETKEQGGVLTETDIAILLRVSGTMISNHVTSYEKRTKKVVPRAGTEMDMGKSLTHKRLAFHNYKKKIPTSENARLIDHTPESVDRYIKDGIRIEKLYTAGYNEWDMAFFTGLPIYVVKEYVEIIKSYEKEKNNKTDIENQ